MMDFLALAQQCAPGVDAHTMLAVSRVESSLNPYAIGVVHGRLARQPRSLAEAVATARALARDGWNFSLGAAQVNRFNLPKYRLDYASAFDPCANLRAGAAILKDCHERALRRTPDGRNAWNMAFSCYYTGNFRSGFRADFKGQPSYVDKVLASVGAGAGRALPPGAVVAVDDAAPPPMPKARPAARAADAWSVLGAREI